MITVRWRRSAALLLVLGAASAGFLFSQDTVSAETNIITLTVDQAVDYANQNSKTLKSSAIDLEMKKRANDYKWNQLLPSVNVSATMSRSNEYTDPTAGIGEMLNPLMQAMGQQGFPDS